MQDVLVSIILPVYNGEQFIKRSINSILKQTYKKIELVIINDGSTDQTEEIILQMKKKDSRIRHYKISNSGVSFARNVGIENARGRYIGFVDADDYIDNTMIEMLVDKAMNYNCDIVSCLYEKKYPNNSVKERVTLKPGYYDKKQLEKYVYPNFFDYNHIPLNVVTKLYNNDLIKENSIKFDEDLKFGEDLLFTRIFLLHSNSFYFLDNLHLYKYNYNEKSVTNKYYPNKWNELKKSIMTRKKITDEYPEYKLEKQYYLSTYNSAVNAMGNVIQNQYSGRHKKVEELSYIVKDSLVRNALENIREDELNIKEKILSYLIKRQKTKTLYLLLELYYKF